jgi:hypothetical protein
MQSCTQRNSFPYSPPSNLFSTGAIRISPQEIMGPLISGGGCPPNYSRATLSTVRLFDRGESGEGPLDGEGVVAVLTVHVQDPEGRAASVGRSLIPLKPGDGGAQPLWIQLFTPTGSNLLDGASKPSLLLVSASYTKRGAPTPDSHCVLPAVICIANHLMLLKSQLTGSGGAAAAAPQSLKLPDGWRWQRSKTTGKVRGDLSPVKSTFLELACGKTVWRHSVQRVVLVRKIATLFSFAVQLMFVHVDNPPSPGFLPQQDNGRDLVASSRRDGVSHRYIRGLGNQHPNS